MGLNYSRRPTMRGKANPRWNGGNSAYPNHSELKKARLVILKKTQGKCEICGQPAKVIHHIDGSKNNHSLNNLIAVCLQCHQTLHSEDNNGVSMKGRPTKYGCIYGMPLKNIAKLFNVTPSAIYCWMKNPEKKQWLEEQLKNRASNQ